MTTLAPSFLIGSSLLLQVTRTPIKSRMGSKLGSIQRRIYELAAHECLKKSPKTYIVTTLVPSFSNGSSSFLEVTRSAIKAWMDLNFDKIPSPFMELAALEHLKN